MFGGIESEIRQLLVEHGDADRVAQLLVKRWRSNLFTETEIHLVGIFLLRAGLHHEILRISLTAIETDGIVPWAAFAESIRKSNIDLKSIEIDAILEGATAQDLLHRVALSKAFDEKDLRITKVRRQFQEKIQAEFNEKRETLKRRLDYARVNRLLSQEKKILDEIQAFDPDDPELKKEKKEFAFRAAQMALEDALAHTPPKEEIERRLMQPSAEMRRVAEPLLKEMKTRAPNMSEAELYDMALMLFFMEFYSESAQLIELGKNHFADSRRLHWLQLEIFIQGRQFAAALGEVEKLEVLFAGDADAPFALTYARARALWGLGETITAIELMRSLVKVRPTYRSCTTLLQQWTEEAP